MPPLPHPSLGNSPRESERERERERERGRDRDGASWIYKAHILCHRISFCLGAVGAPPSVGSRSPSTHSAPHSISHLTLEI